MIVWLLLSCAANGSDSNDLESTAHVSESDTKSEDCVGVDGDAAGLESSLVGSWTGESVAHEWRTPIEMSFEADGSWSFSHAEADTHLGSSGPYEGTGTFEVISPRLIAVAGPGYDDQDEPDAELQTKRLFSVHIDKSCRLSFASESNTIFGNSYEAYFVLTRVEE